MTYGARIGSSQPHEVSRRPPGITSPLNPSFEGFTAEVPFRPRGSKRVRCIASAYGRPVMFASTSPKMPYAASEYIVVSNAGKTGRLLRINARNAALTVVSARKEVEQETNLREYTQMVSPKNTLQSLELYGNLSQPHERQGQQDLRKPPVPP